MENNYKRKNNFFCYLFMTATFAIITILKRLDQSTDNFKTLKDLPRKQFLTIESLKITQEIGTTNEQNYLTPIALSKIKYKHHSSVFKFIMLLSSDANLNPGPQNNVQQQNNCQQQNKFDIFCKRGLQFIHLNSLIPKIESQSQYQLTQL